MLPKGMKKKRESKLSECRRYHLGKNNAVILLNHPSSESLVLVLYSILRVHKNTINSLQMRWIQREVFILPLAQSVANS